MSGREKCLFKSDLGSTRLGKCWFLRNLTKPSSVVFYVLSIVTGSLDVDLCHCVGQLVARPSEQIQRETRRRTCLGMSHRLAHAKTCARGALRPDPTLGSLLWEPLCGRLHMLPSAQAAWSNSKHLE
eukprot:6433243-Amphidinium_carterae.1